ncbi:MAG: hypothetical protein OEU92_09565 [Alphaproteobacteria bacterium]|nr:hypothetical protein [Alphaproteobacteria bacterium]
MEASVLIEFISRFGMPAAIAALLWFKVERMEKNRSSEIDKYIAIIEKISAQLAENTSALNRLDR